MIKQFDLENAVDSLIIKDLIELLQGLTVKDLKYIGNLLYLCRLSNKSKQELIQIIYTALTDEEIITYLIERFIDKEFNLLKDLMNNKGTIQDDDMSADTYYFLYATGLIFIFEINNKTYISMTDDVYNVIKKIDLKQFEKTVEENTKVYNLIRAMVELYGLVPCSELNYYYSLYYGNGKELEAPTKTLFSGERIDNMEIYVINDKMYFAHGVLRDKNLKKEIIDIISRQKIIKRKPIKLEELLKYSDYNYYEETEAKIKFKNYLKKEKVSSDTIEEIIKLISDMNRYCDDNIKPLLEMLNEQEVGITQENIQKILDFLADIYNNSRIWVNNGWTPVELMKEDNKNG